MPVQSRVAVWASAKRKAVARLMSAKMSDRRAVRYQSTHPNDNDARKRIGRAVTVAVNLGTADAITVTQRC